MSNVLHILFYLAKHLSSAWEICIWRKYNKDIVLYLQKWPLWRKPIFPNYQRGTPSNFEEHLEHLAFYNLCKINYTILEVNRSYSWSLVISIPFISNASYNEIKCSYLFVISESMLLFLKKITAAKLYKLLNQPYGQKSVVNNEVISIPLILIGLLWWKDIFLFVCNLWKYVRCILDRDDILLCVVEFKKLFRSHCN